MFRTSTLLIILCLSLTVSEGRSNSKMTRLPEARHEDSPLRRIMIFNNEGYKVSDQHRDRVWGLYRNRLGIMNHTDNNQDEGQVSDLTITQADGRRGLQIPFGSDPSSRLGLAPSESANSFVWTPVMKPRKAPSYDDPSINEIDSADYFPPQNVNISTTTEKTDIVSGNDSIIVPGSNNRVGGSEIEWLTSTTTTTTKAPDTRVSIPEHPTSFLEFINAQLSLLEPMWSNFFKLTDHFSREIENTMTYILDILWEVFVLFFSARKRRAIEFNMSEL